MNANRAIEQLEMCFNGFIVHPDLPKEIICLIDGTGYEKIFFHQLIHKLTILSEHHKHIVQIKDFERLSYAPEFYSIHLHSNGKFNIRILFSMPEEGIILLHTFYERGRKRSTDYTKQIPIAKKRLSDLMGKE